MVLFLLLSLALLEHSFQFPEDEMRETVTEAYNWILSVSSDGEFTESNTNQNQYDLYSGSAGVLIYSLELYEFTKDEGVLNLTKSIANNLMMQYSSEIESKFDLSLFHKGLSGIAFTFHVLYDYVPDESYRDFAWMIDEVILTRFSSEKMPNCLRWGYAGTALYLLWLYDRTTDQVTRDSILQNCTLGVKKVLENAVETKDGSGYKWYYANKKGVEMPGYADGTAGVVYMLLQMYEKTQDTTYLTYSTKGMNYLQSIANLSGNGCLIYHSHNLLDDAAYYLGECNGNTGHIKAFLKMYNVTGNKTYLNLAVRSGNSLLEYYQTYNWWIPKLIGWFWNTMSLCDGSVGVIESLHILQQYYNYGDYDKAINDIITNILSRKVVPKGTTDYCYWTQAENRDQPKKTWNQVGMYQGAGGITMTFIHLLSKDTVRIKLPDYLF